MSSVLVDHMSWVSDVSGKVYTKWVMGYTIVQEIHMRRLLNGCEIAER